MQLQGRRQAGAGHRNPNGRGQEHLGGDECHARCWHAALSVQGSHHPHPVITADHHSRDRNIVLPVVPSRGGVVVVGIVPRIVVEDHGHGPSILRVLGLASIADTRSVVEVAPGSASAPAAGDQHHLALE